MSVSGNLAAVNEALEQYRKINVKLTTAEILEKKGRDLGIQLFRGFWALRQKGVTASMKNPADAVFSGPMFKQAEARGWATKIRATELTGPYASLYDAGATARLLKNRKGDYLLRKDAAPTKQALLIAQELATRQRGVGLMGVSFLSKRWRRRDPIKGGDYLVQNTSGKLGLLSSVEQVVDASGGGFFRLKSQVPGLSNPAVPTSSIIAAALAEVRRDMLVYITDRQGKAVVAQLNQISKAGIPL